MQSLSSPTSKRKAVSMEIVISLIGTLALVGAACAFEVLAISKCPKEDNGDYVEPNEGK